MEAPSVDPVAAVSPALADQVRDLVARHRAAHGHPGLGDGRLRGLGAGPLAAAEARDGATLVGWAQVDEADAGDRPTLEVVTLDVGDALVGRLADTALGALGPGPVRWWVSHAGPDDDARAAARGFRVERELLQLRCTLPLAPPGPAEVTVTTRAFRPGVDEAGWLAQNNRAFADHPEQGGWDAATLEARESEPWFDADGFRVLEVDGRIAASCWTRVHPGRPPLGEIYVIGVDPEFHGRGWGRALTRAGFDWLAGAGLSHGMLYVDAANTAALGLYRSLGMTTDHLDRAYVRDAP